MTAELDLFTIAAAKPAPAPKARMVGRIPLRFCQREDVDAMMFAIEQGHRKPACVAATGYGKGSMIAETAGRLRNDGKVLCLVDRAHLAHQLADEIDYHLDTTCGRVADGVSTGLNRQIVVSTVQAMYTPDRSGKPLYAYSQFDKTRAVIADEAHKFFADAFRSVLQHFASEHGAVIPLFTATPVAANGARWQSFVDWTPSAEGPCMRTTGWCVRNGYLVPPKQAFIRVNLKLNEIYERLSQDESDDEDRGDELSELLLSLLHDKGEKAAATFATGVADVIGSRKALIFTPRRIKAAQLIASWIGATGRMTCLPVWGAQVEKENLLERFKGTNPQSLANVDLLCEGFNNPLVSAVFICRMLKSWRLVNQMVGRALRPHPDVVDALNGFDELEQDEQRREAIASSPKPDALIADLVGLEDKVIQASAIEVLYADEGEDVRTELGEVFKRRTEQKETEQQSDAEALAQAKEQLRQKQNERLAELARQRTMAGGIEADVSVEYGGRAPEAPSAPTPISTASVGEKAMFVAHATQYDLQRAMSMADRTPKHILKGMTFGMKKKLESTGKRPDWTRARKAYPEWRAK